MTTKLASWQLSGFIVYSPPCVLQITTREGTPLCPLFSSSFHHPCVTGDSRKTLGLLTSWRIVCYSVNKTTTAAMLASINSQARGGVYVGTGPEIFTARPFCKDNTVDCNMKLHVETTRIDHRSDSRAPFYYHGLTLIPAWINNYIHYKVWDEITYPFLNFNGCTVEV